MIACCVIPQDLSPSASPTFEGLRLNGLSASQAVLTDANKNLVSADWLDQAVKTTSSPTFSSVGFVTTNGTYSIQTCSLQSGLAVVPSSNYTNIFRLYSKNGDGTQTLGLHFIPVGTVASVTNSERFFMGWSPSYSRFVFHSAATGTGTLRPLAMGADTGSAATIQLYLATNGKVGIQTSSPSYALQVNGDIFATHLRAQDGYNGSFTDGAGEEYFVVDGIIVGGP